VEATQGLGLPRAVVDAIVSLADAGLLLLRAEVYWEQQQQEEEQQQQQAQQQQGKS
jgi:hypothetical protein